MSPFAPRAAPNGLALPAPSPRLFIIEHDEGDAARVTAALGGSKPRLEVIRSDAATLPGMLREHPPDIVLVAAGSLDPVAVLSEVRAASLDVPIIVLAPPLGEERVAEMLRQGATDYVMKSEHFPRLLPAIWRALDERDVKRRQAEAEARLQAALATQRALVEMSPLAILSFTLEGKLESTNPATRAFFELHADHAPQLPSSFGAGELEGHAHLEDLLGPDAAARILESIRRGEHFDGASLTASRASGEVLEASIWTACIGKAPTALCLLILADATERRRHERELARVHDGLFQSNKMEALGRLAAGVAHDFNNLLTVMLGTTEMLLDELPTEFPFREDVAAAHDAAHRAAALTQQLLLFSRRGASEAPRTIDVGRAVRASERLMGRLVGDSIRLELDVDRELPAVHLDPVHLEQVVLNLLVNARDALLPRGGRVAIRVRDRLVEACEAAALGVPPGHFISLEVRDDGAGMDETTRKRAFEPFFTTKDTSRGTGLGLATVYGVATNAGGAVRLESTPRVGTCVEVLLPVAGVGHATPTPTIPARRPALDQRLAILLVEGDPAVRRLMRSTLTRAGHDVVEAENPGEALLLAERRANGFELIISDVAMPFLSGPALARRLRRAAPSLATLLVGGEGPDDELPTDVARLQKPFTPDALLRGVTRAMMVAPRP